MAVIDSDERALGVGERDDGGAELNALEGGVLGDVAGTRDGDALARVGAGTGILEHVADVVDEAVAGGLGADERSTPVEALAGKDTLELVALTAVGTEEVADLAATNANVASGNIGVGTDVAGQLAHEGDAEAADLGIRLALGVEVGTTLATTHHQAGEGILEDLLEAEELETVFFCQPPRSFVSFPPLSSSLGFFLTWRG